jgi:hypothetical protein
VGLPWQKTPVAELYQKPPFSGDNKFIGKHGCHDKFSLENMVATMQIHRKTLLLRNKFIGKHCCYETNSSENGVAHVLILQPPFLRKFNGIPWKTEHGFQ